LCGLINVAAKILRFCILAVQEAKMTLRKFHFYFGLTLFAGFIFTGLYMRFNFANVPHENIPVRMMFRANHIYILLASLIHLLISFVNTTATKKFLELTGSIISIVATVTLFIAFFIDPITNSLQRDITRLSVVGLFAGTILLLLNFKLSSKNQVTQQDL
jgi:hypothetical protein